MKSEPENQYFEQEAGVVSEPENQYFEQEYGVVEDYEKIAEMQHFYSRLWESLPIDNLNLFGE